MKLGCLALLLAGVWVAALTIIDHTIGSHSTPGFWTIILGFPGLNGCGLDCSLDSSH